MNIIYKLTNRNRTDGKRFYIGSKTECKLLEIDGVQTIYNMHEKKPYYGSSTSFEFKEDFRAGHVFEAEILEIVTKRENLRDRENFYLKKFNAVESDEYYNLSYAFLLSHSHEAIKNKFGETVAEYANAQSQVSKRDNTAFNLGFKNFGELYFSLYRRLQNGEMTHKISAEYKKHRKWVQITLRPYNMEKAELDLIKTSAEEIRNLLIEGASLKHAAKILDIELPAARVLLGDFNKLTERAFSVAKGRGKSKEELEKEIIMRVLNGEGIHEICNSMSLCRASILRYFFRHLRAHKEELKKVLCLESN